MKNWMYAAVLSMGMVITGPALAATITFGVNNGIGNGFPFSAPLYKAEYQQVYDGSLFSGPASITQITFFSVNGGPTGITGNFTLNLSTTSAGVNSLSTVYANNIGANNALFFTGGVSNTFSFTGTPFLFNPAQGNLLLDVLVNTPSPTNQLLAAGCATNTNRVINLIQNGLPGPTAIGNGGLCGSNPFGLQTQFTFTAVSIPEPAPIAMFGAGLLGLLGLSTIRARKQA